MQINYPIPHAGDSAHTRITASVRILAKNSFSPNQISMLYLSVDARIMYFCETLLFAEDSARECTSKRNSTVALFSTIVKMSDSEKSVENGEGERGPNYRAGEI